MFLDESYTDLPDGALAKEFFDAYVVMDAYEDLQFYYNDQGRRIGVPEWRTLSVVDVYYSKEAYATVEQALLRRSLERSYGDDCGRFTGYRVQDEDALYDANAAYILFDKRYTTVRYVFLSDCPEAVALIDVWDETHHAIPTNQSSRTWAFDYSERLFAEFRQKANDLYPLGNCLTFMQEKDGSWVGVVEDQGEIHLLLATVDEQGQTFVTSAAERLSLGQRYAIPIDQRSERRIMLCASNAEAPSFATESFSFTSEDGDAYVLYVGTERVADTEE